MKQKVNMSMKVRFSLRFSLRIRVWLKESGESSVPNENFTQQIGFAKGSGQSVGFASCLGFYSLIERIVG